MAVSQYLSISGSFGELGLGLGWHQGGVVRAPSRNVKGQEYSLPDRETASSIGGGVEGADLLNSGNVTPGRGRCRSLTLTS